MLTIFTWASSQSLSFMNFCACPCTASSFYFFSLVWITKAFNLEWLPNLREQGKPQNKPSKIRAVTQLENANLKDIFILLTGG